MISVDFKHVSKSVLVGFAANPLIVAFRGMKVLPSVCESVPSPNRYLLTDVDGNRYDVANMELDEISRAYLWRYI